MMEKYIQDTKEHALLLEEKKKSIQLKLCEIDEKIAAAAFDVCVDTRELNLLHFEYNLQNKLLEHAEMMHNACKSVLSEIESKGETF